MSSYIFFFFNDTATTEIYTLSLHDALPISRRGARRSECGDQFGFLFLRLAQMAPLDVAEAADVLGYACDLRRELLVLAVQLLEQLGDGRLVLADQPPFGLALLAHPEEVERRAAQALQFRENAERRHHPGAELRLPRLTGARIGLVEDRWSKVAFEPVAAFEHAFDFSRKPGIGVKPRHFVLVLVGHELEVISCDGLGEREFSFARSDLLRFRRAHSFDQLPVSLCVGAVLVAGEEIDPA